MMSHVNGPGKGHKVPGKIREQIIFAFTSQGKSYDQIVTELHLSKSTVQKVISRYSQKNFRPSENKVTQLKLAI